MILRKAKYAQIFLVTLFLIMSSFDIIIAQKHTPLISREVDFAQDLYESYELATQWFSHSMRDKGLFRYNFKPGKKNIYGTKNNAIRQLMGTRLMAEMCHEDSSLIPLHKKNMDFLLKWWYKEKEGKDELMEAYMLYNKKSKLGANAMMLRAFIISPFYDDYKEEAEKMYNGIKACTYDDGGMKPFYHEPGYGYNKDYLLTFYSGEAIVALAEYAQKTNRKDVLELAIKCQDHYIQKYVVELEENYYPAYVPWHTISLNLLYKITGDKKYAEAAMILNDKVLELQDTTNYVGRFFNPKTPQYGSPHTSSDGVYTEGLAYAYELAKHLKDEKRAQQYLKAIELSIGNLRYVQFTPGECQDFELPERAIGGFKSTTIGEWVRIDCGQHILDAYRKLLRLMGEESILSTL